MDPLLSHTNTYSLANKVVSACHLLVSTSLQSYKTTNNHTSWRPFCVHMLLSLHWPELKLWEASGNCWIASLYSDSTCVLQYLLWGRSSLFSQNSTVTFSTKSSAVYMSEVGLHLACSSKSHYITCHWAQVNYARGHWFSFSMVVVLSKIMAELQKMEMLIPDTLWHVEFAYLQQRAAYIIF